jgi:hypothetical protein
LTVVFEDRSYTIAAMDAVEWIALLDGPSPDAYEIFPMSAGVEAVGHVEDALWEGRATSDDIARLGQDAISAAADRPWWVVMNLLASVKGAWSVVHVNQAAGMSLAGWLDEVWSKTISHIDPKKKASWVSDIERPPKGTGQEIDFDAEEAAFLAAMNAVMK